MQSVVLFLRVKIRKTEIKQINSRPGLCYRDMRRITGETVKFSKQGILPVRLGALTSPRIVEGY